MSPSTAIHVIAEILASESTVIAKDSIVPAYQAIEAISAALAAGEEKNDGAARLDLLSGSARRIVDALLETDAAQFQFKSLLEP